MISGSRGRAVQSDALLAAARGSFGYRSPQSAKADLREGSSGDAAAFSLSSFWTSSRCPSPARCDAKQCDVLKYHPDMLCPGLTKLSRIMAPMSGHTPHAARLGSIRGAVERRTKVDLPLPTGPDAEHFAFGECEADIATPTTQQIRASPGIWSRPASVIPRRQRQRSAEHLPTDWQFDERNVCH